MSDEHILQFDEAALCLFHRLQLLYEDTHAWSRDGYRVFNVQGNHRFFRLTDIAHERDQVSRDLADHIAYILLSDQPYKMGIPGINLEEALLIKGLVNDTHLEVSFEEAMGELHDALMALKLTR